MHAGFQKHIWANGAGDDWYRRNEGKLGTRDLTEGAIESLKLQPKNVLEIGSANGWRLKKLREKYDCRVTGIDPSANAREAGFADDITIWPGTADNLDCFGDETFDLVIFGFCLCFISPEDWIPLVKESNRVLRDEGHLVIYDFVGTRFLKRRMMNITNDKKLEELPLYLYNFNWPELWLAHPAYKVAVDYFDLNNSEVCTILHKGIGRMLDDEIRVA